MNQVRGSRGPIKPGEGTSLTRLLLALGLIILLLLVGLGIRQYRAYPRETRYLEDQISKAKREVSRIRDIAKDRNLVEREVAFLQKALRESRPLVPPAMEVESFLEDLARWAKRSGLTEKKLAFEEDSTGPLQRATISVMLLGNRKKASKLCAGEEMKRRINCLEKKPLPNGVALRFEIFALPDSAKIASPPSPERPDQPSPCAELKGFSSQVWLPPFADQIRRREAEWKKRCHELDLLAATEAKVEELEQEKRELAARISIMEDPQKFMPR